MTNNENTNPDYLGNESNLNQNSETSQVKHQTGDLTSNSIQTNFQDDESTTNNESNEMLQSDYQSSESKENHNNEQSVKSENSTQQVNQINNRNYNYNNYNRGIDFSLPTTFEDYVKLSENFYAGFWQRFMAYIIDLIVVASITGLFNTVTLNYLNVGVKLSLIGEYTLSFIIVLFTYFILMTYFFSQTLGKVIMKIKVFI